MQETNPPVAASTPEKAEHSASLAGVSSSSKEAALTDDLPVTPCQAEALPEQHTAWNMRQRPTVSAEASAPVPPAPSNDHPGLQSPLPETTASHQQNGHSRQSAAEDTALQCTHQQRDAAPSASCAEGQAPRVSAPGLSLEDKAAERSGAAASISGTGYLIWLPDGRLSGAGLAPSLLQASCVVGFLNAVRRSCQEWLALLGRNVCFRRLSKSASADKLH